VGKKQKHHSSQTQNHKNPNTESIAGVGNIFRAEICHFARVHPDTPAAAIDRPTFEAVWAEAVRQLRAGFECGSILTVPDSARPRMVDPSARRAVYNRPRCATCGGRVVAWDINARTAYACEACQPRKTAKVEAITPATPAASKKSAPRLFASKCAPDASSPAHLTVPQLRAALAGRGVADTKGLAKAGLVARLEALVKAEEGGGGGGAVSPATPASTKRGRGGSSTPRPGTAGLTPAAAAAAAAEKAAAGEGRNVEHVPLDAGDATVWLGKKGKAAAAAGPATPAPKAKAKKEKAAPAKKARRAV
jgi:DNA-directed RNA polymerase subunit RPC12/RpoP